MSQKEGDERQERTRGGDQSVPVSVITAGLPNLFPSTDPDDSNTPEEALQPLATELARDVSSHEKDCTHVPPPLRTLAGMRQHTLMKTGSLARMRSVLWRYRDHPFIQDVCHEWLRSVNEELKTWVDDTEHGTTFPDILAAARPDKKRLTTVASVLWSLGFDRDPELSWSFTLVCGLMRVNEEPQLSPKPSRSDRAQERRMRDAEGEILNLTGEISRLKGELSEVRRSKSEMRRQIEDLERDRQELSKKLDEHAPEMTKLREELQRVNDDLESERAARRAMAKDVGAEKRRRRDLEERLDEEARKTSAVEEQRVAASSDVNAARLRIRQLEERLSTAPASTQQVKNYLDAEDARLEEDLLRLQGGDAEEARVAKAMLRKLRNSFLDYRPEYRQPRPPPRRSAGPLKYYALGGAEEIGASAYVIELGNHRILIDAGIRVGRPLQELGPDLGRLGPIDALILTHAHTDHVGWAAAVVRHLSDQGDFEIFATPETTELLPVMLKDSRKQYERMAAQERVDQKYVVGHKLHADPYERADVEEVIRRLRPVRLDEPVPIGADIRFSFHSAGHILGAASVLIEGDGRRVFATGDFSDFWQITVRDHHWPENAGPVDLLLLEATYGSRTHPDRAAEQQQFMHDVLDVVDRGGVSLVSCFALGRAQEVLSLLAGTMRAARSCPVWIDGMIQDINEVYRRFHRLTLPANFREVRSGGWTREEVLEQVRREPAIIVSTSGMLTGGPMVEYAAALLPDGRNRIFFCGYLDEESPGHALQRLSDSRGGRRVVSVEREDGSRTDIRAATPAGTFNLSAHADSHGLTEAASLLSPAATVLVHGDPEARASLAQELNRRKHHVHASSLEFAIDRE